MGHQKKKKFMIARYSLPIIWERRYWVNQFWNVWRATVAESELKMADFYVFAVWNVRNAYPLCFSPLTLVFRTHASQCIHKLHLILSALWAEPVNRLEFTTSIRHMLVYGVKEAQQIIAINNTNMLQYQGSSVPCPIRNHLTLWIAVFFFFLMGWDW
jgi:hypothetical protein